VRALITGGSGAIGESLVREFACDCEVIFTYLSNNVKAAEIEKVTGACGVKCDVRDRENIDKIIREYSHFDLLINNAGISQIKLFTDVTAQDWDDMLAVNLTGAFNFTQSVLPSMLRRKSGAIINISSLWGETGASCEVHYSASKAGLIGFTKALAKEVEPSGIRINCIAPGAVESPMNEGFSHEDLLGACSFRQSGEVKKPEDVAKAARTLAEDKGVTGRVIIL